MILNTDIPATRPVHVDPVFESLDEEMSDGVGLVVDELSIVIIIVTGGDLLLSCSTLLMVKTPYT